MIITTLKIFVAKLNPNAEVRLARVIGVFTCFFNEIRSYPAIGCVGFLTKD